KRGEAETGTKVGVIVCGIRTRSPAESLELARAAAEYRTAGVVAFDLAGAERGFAARDHAEAFAYAARQGLACTCHAGEGDGPDSIHQALHACGARRIGHGTRLGEDAALLEFVVEHRIPLEMCLTSNLHTHTVTFVCALAVFTLPRFAWNTIQAAGRQQPAAPAAPAQATSPAPTPTPAAPRSAGQRLTGILGIVFILGLGAALSRNRRAISRRVVAWGLGLLLVFAIFVLRVPFGQTLFAALGEAVKKILGFSYVGSEFVFGEIGKQHSSLGIIFAFQVLPAIIFVSALFAILYYLGVM